MKTVNRRDFLKISSIAGASLLVSIYLEGCSPEEASVPTSTTNPTALPTEGAPRISLQACRHRDGRM